MAGLGALLGANPVTAGIGMGLNVLGGISNVIGAVGQKNEAKRQMQSQKAFGSQQRLALKAGQADLLTQARGLPTFQGDITRFLKTQQEAENQKLMASGGGRVAGQAIAEEQSRQTTANTLAAAERGAQSSSDLLTAALMGQQQEGSQMQNIASQSMQQRQQMQQQAQQNYLSTLGQTAAAQAQQAGMQFQSESQKANQIFGLGQEQLGQSMNLEQNLFQSEQAKAAAFQQARSAIFSGIGGIAQSIGSGLMGMNAQQNQMSMLEKMYPSGAGQGLTTAQQQARAAFGSGASLANIINPSFGTMQGLKANRLQAPQAPIYSTGFDGQGNIVTPFFNS